MDVIIVPAFKLMIAVMDIYVWLVIAQIIFSWLVAFGTVNTSNRFVYMVGDFLYRVTEPVLGRIRRVMPDLGSFDLSPVILILVIFFVQEFLIRLLMKFV